MPMLLRLVIVGVAGVAAGASSAPRFHSDDPSCVTQQDTVQPHLEKFQWIVANTPPAILADGHLQSGPPEGVTIVGDETVCAQAVTAYNSRFTGADTMYAVSRIIVLRAGTNRYVVTRPTSPAGAGWRSWSIYDSTFHFLGVMTGT